MDHVLAASQLLSRTDGISGLPIQRRTVTDYDDIREETSIYSHSFAEDDPHDRALALVTHDPEARQDG